LFFAMLLGVGACTGQGSGSKSPSPRGEACDVFARPCAEGQTCVDGKCRKRMCTTDADCGGSGACFEGWCVASECRNNAVCMGEDGVAGTQDDRSCVGGVCLPMSCPRDGKRCPAPGRERCNWSSDCDVGKICFDGVCVVGRCQSNHDCLPNACFGGLCFPTECDDHRPCPSGRNCVGTVCVKTAVTSSE
jgi:hypothetical protein